MFAYSTETYSGQFIIKHMDKFHYSCISPIDGRYSDKLTDVSKYFSEIGFIRAKILIELKYWSKIVGLLNKDEIKFVTSERFGALSHDVIQNHVDKTSDSDLYNLIRQYENITKHDTKSIEYALGDIFKEYGLSKYTPYIHIGLTSQDIVSFAYNYNIKLFREEIFEKKILDTLYKISESGERFNSIPILTRTHGQPAIIHWDMKELVFTNITYRLALQYDKLNAIKQEVKFGGAIGNLDAHSYIGKNTNWGLQLSNLMDSFGLKRQTGTTQIENYEHLSEYLDGVKRLNNIFIDFCRDMWHYISISYIKIQKDDNQVGSSTMPQKINPINFENAEGNLEYANAQLTFLSDKLMKSRLQRDLTDSTVMRNIGVVFSHCLLAYDSIAKGVSSISPDLYIYEDINNNGQVLAEKIQTIFRYHKHSNAYEKIKDIFMGNKISIDDALVIISKFIYDPEISEEIKLDLQDLVSDIENKLQ